jgi:translation initiation factor 1
MTRNLPGYEFVSKHNFLNFNSHFATYNTMAKDWKDRLGVVYSTNKDFEYQTHGIGEQNMLPPSKQTLRVSIDRKHRKGKSVTLITGFVGSDDDLKDLAKLIKTKCGVGGSAKDGDIIIQGEWVEKVRILLTEMGYSLK